jgi:uncharacterized protein (DUF362 family)
MKNLIRRRSSERSTVSIVHSTYSNVRQNIADAISLAGSIKLSGTNRIVVKINLCDARTPDTGAITHPAFLDAVLEYLRRAFKDSEIVVVESDGRVVLADLYVKWFGLLRVIEKWGAKWRNLSNEPCEMKKIRTPISVELPVPLLFEDSFFITLPKLKTNILTKITCCIKNQRGCNPMLNKQQFHKCLDKAIVAENLAAGVPDFCIVDGIIGMGTMWGPSFGMPIHSDVIVAGKDEVAVDCVCSKIMGFDPKRIGHIRLAKKYGLGSTKYKIVGNQINEVKTDFKWNTVNAMLFGLAQRMRDRQFKSMREDYQ